MRSYSAMFRLVVFIFCLSNSNSAMAVDENVGDGPTKAYKTEFTFEPRVWIAAAGEKYHSGRTDFQESLDMMWMPLYGATASIKPQGMSTKFRLSGYYGTGSGEYAAIRDNGNSYFGNGDVSRLDLEFLALWDAGGNGLVSYGLGGRYVRLATNINAVDANQVRVSNQETTNFYLGEFAGSFRTPFPASDNLHILGGTTIMAGYANFYETSEGFSGQSFGESGPVAGIDAYAGLQYELIGGDNSIFDGNFNIRYRIFAGSGLDFSDTAETTSFLVHGLEMGLNIKF